MIVKNNFKNLFYVFFLVFSFTSISNANFVFGKPYYNRHEIIKVYTDNKRAEHLKVFKNDSRFSPFEDMEKIHFQQIDVDLKVAYIPLGFNPPTGSYEIKFYSSKKLLETKKISVYPRKIEKINPPFHSFTVEYGGNLNKIKVGVPSKKGYSNEKIKELLQYLNIDNLFFMVGQTNAKLKEVHKDNPWIPENLTSWKKFNTKFKDDFTTGGYVGCFLCFGPAISKFPQYEFSYDYSFDYGLYRSNFISIDDSNRIKDISKLVQKIDDDKDVEFVGLDYIRAGQGGFENYKEFITIFNLDLPGKSKREKILQLAKSVKNDRKPNIKKKWEYFRAYKTSQVIESMANAVDKTIWVFTLGWEQGHNHGQDPIMFTDAGADVIFVMLYEATHSEYEDMMQSWEKYLAKTENLQLVIGQDIDYPLNDNPQIRKSGPEEMLKRYKKAYKVFSINDNLKGFFLHDLVRAFYGRLYPYQSKEWLYSAGSALTYFNINSDEYNFSISAEKTGRNIYFTVKNEYNNSIKLERVTFRPGYWNKYQYQDIVIEPESEAIFELPYRYYHRKMERQYITMIFKFDNKNFFKTLYFDSIKYNK
ncbi:MAG: hypothetical protein FXF47_03160 [Candidatus Mcinerneyibacterium aminivorans]|uniref:Uncharacterized protein n=1 Tax=Candidatus Mcinerneyibacterium aminivorans TaxID=2703815 RepID=A0A5D0MM03_9BACT|nr:MAG: hypothetical protein FXF47_03160 [Candidatus Mcinerneyibacterium aminivorans]